VLIWWWCSGAGGCNSSSRLVGVLLIHFLFAIFLLRLPERSRQFAFPYFLMLIRFVFSPFSFIFCLVP